MVLVQISNDLLNSSLHHFVTAWPIVKSSFRHVIQDKPGVYDVLMSLLDEKMEGMIDK